MTWKRYPKAEEVAFYLRLGQNIYQLRKSRKISQEELAWRADCSQKYISNIELGKARASVVLCARIAAALHCSMMRFLQIYFPENKLRISLLLHLNEL